MQTDTPSQPRPRPARTSPSCPAGCAADGLFRRRGGYYAVSIPVHGRALAVLAVVVVLLGAAGGTWPWRWPWPSSWPSSASSVTTPVIARSGPGVGRTTRSGLVLANLLSGVSFGWWLTKHTRHHGHTNDDGKDPDIVAGVLVYTARQAG